MRLKREVNTLLAACVLTLVGSVFAGSTVLGSPLNLEFKMEDESTFEGTAALVVGDTLISPIVVAQSKAYVEIPEQFIGHVGRLELFQGSHLIFRSQPLNLGPASMTVFVPRFRMYIEIENTAHRRLELKLRIGRQGFSVIVDSTSARPGKAVWSPDPGSSELAMIKSWRKEDIEVILQSEGETYRTTQTVSEFVNEWILFPHWRIEGGPARRLNLIGGFATDRFAFGGGLDYRFVQIRSTFLQVGASVLRYPNGWLVPTYIGISHWIGPAFFGEGQLEIGLRGGWSLGAVDEVKNGSFTAADGLHIDAFLILGKIERFDVVTSLRVQRSASFDAFENSEHMTLVESTVMLGIPF